MSAEDQAAAEMPLGARIHRLQRIAADLDREDIELEDAMRLFEEGVAHLRAAESLVKQAELRIERLLEDARGVRLEEIEPPE
ncbi:MAG TPA: exodeoxyribonuclease VII small subunit [Longimicrobiales bacterium]